MQGTHGPRRGLLWALSAALGLLPGCGGSGGPGTETPTVPGLLVALALEGEPTPAGGTYGPFVPQSLLSAAAGGWTAFVAEVVGGSTTKALFVARPSGSVSLVYGVGDTVPATNGGSGTITDFRRIWMRPNGIVVALVDKSGASSQGILTALVAAGGSVSEKAGAVYVGRSLPAGAGAGNPGTLTLIDEDLIQVANDGGTFFEGTGSGGTPLHGIWKVSRDGTQIGPVAVTGDPAPLLGTVGFIFSGLGCDDDGLLAAYACDVIGGPTEAIFATRGAATVRVAADGDSPPSTPGRLFSDVLAGSPLVVGYDASGTGFVTWRGLLTGAAPSAGLFTRRAATGGNVALGALETLVVPGQVFANAAGGFASDCRLLPGQNDPAAWPIEIEIAGGNTDRVFVSSPNQTTGIEIFRQGDVAPGTTTTFANSYPSAGLPRNDTAAREGSIGLTAVLFDGTSGLWWAVSTLTSFPVFLVAREGGAAPGTTGTFAPFSTPSSVSVADQFLAFRAAIFGGTNPSGIFRQG